jgi:dihydrofolate reductase
VKRSSLKTTKEDLITMAKVRCDISMSLDGFVAGPNASLEEPLGAGGELLHEWAFAATSWRESHGLSGGESNADSDVIEESITSTGAVVMGRRMFSGGQGPWEPDPRANGWWGDEPPFHVPVFVLTHHARETLVMEGGTSFAFVTDGIEAALEQARAAAGDKDVLLAGGASIVQQYLKAGLTDELQIHVAPVLLGDGVSLFDRLGIGALALETTRVIASPSVTHLRFGVPARPT